MSDQDIGINGSAEPPLRRLRFGDGSPTRHDILAAFLHLYPVHGTVLESVFVRLAEEAELLSLRSKSKELSIHPVFITAERYRRSGVVKHTGYICPNCEYKDIIFLFNYCPSCGRPIAWLQVEVKKR